MRKPRTRKERLEWLAYRKGIDYVTAMYAMTDHEVKVFFDQVYVRYKDLPAFERKTELPVCLVCESEVRITWDCSCGENMAIIDPDDPELEERRKEREAL